MSQLPTPCQYRTFFLLCARFLFAPSAPGTLPARAPARCSGDSCRFPKETLLAFRRKGLNDIAKTQLNRVDTDFLRREIHHPLERIIELRAAEATIETTRHLV